MCEHVSILDLASNRPSIDERPLALPPAVNTAVHARLAELAETMQPSQDEFEVAFDIAAYGIRGPSVSPR